MMCIEERSIGCSNSIRGRARVYSRAVSSFSFACNIRVRGGGELRRSGKSDRGSRAAYKEFMGGFDVFMHEEERCSSLCSVSFYCRRERTRSREFLWSMREVYEHVDQLQICRLGEADGCVCRRRVGLWRNHIAGSFKHAVYVSSEIEFVCFVSEEDT